MDRYETNYNWIITSDALGLAKWPMYVTTWGELVLAFWGGVILTRLGPYYIRSGGPSGRVLVRTGAGLLWVIIATPAWLL